MSRLNDFLTEARVFFLATNDGAQPKLRPLGAHLEMDGKVVFGVGDFKQVYKQLVTNPLCEIAACMPDGTWLRYTGKAVFETDPKYGDAIIASIPPLKDIYNDQTGNRMMAFHLEEATAVIKPMIGTDETIL